MSDDVPHTIRRGELDILQIDNASCSAEVSLFGGHILHWQPSGQKPVLWMSESANYDGNTALRGGIPICWPWFGPAGDKGRHGLVRTRNWQLDSYQEDCSTTKLTLGIKLSDDENPWPHPSKIEMKLELGKELKQTLIITNDTEKPLCFAYALHNYFQVSHPENIEAPALTNSFFENAITGETQLVDKGDESYTGPIDRIYLNDENASLYDKKFDRTINIKKTGSQHWVLWNPGIEDARNMADVHQDGENEFLCFEAANTTDIIIDPGETIRVGQAITVE
ncbi:D-hexose-6-phosphate mutarotase [Teredinibacter haidensis]|uniref:D-hexose-6-phosphate mutarotase n=1 Tax=Teredinibacter haidensis TaxID=2731755 RepID=UPI000948DA3C|nr:D-hexose-6-phosphate mutarotase [Teredinibacter haidensis]